MKKVSACGALVACIWLGIAQGALAQSDSCSNAEFRVGLPSAHLPDCRAYEQVSPVDKNGSDVTYGTPVVSFGPLPVHDDGEAALFRSNGAFAGTPWGGGQSPTAYFSRRGEDGWETQSTVARPQNQAAQIVSLRSVRPDFEELLINGADSLIPGEPAPLGGLYSRDTRTGALVRLVPGTGTGVAVAPFMWSADSSRVTFSAAAVLVPQPAPPAPQIPAAGNKAYELVDGEIRLISRLPTDAPVVGQVGSYGTTPVTRSLSNAVSADGQHIFFTNPIGGTMGTTPTTRQSIYRRTDGSTTVLATPSKRTDCAGDLTCGGDSIPDPAPDPLPGAKKFETATPDGNRVFFTSPELLTDDANTAATRTDTAARELYRYDLGADEMVAISAETNDVDGAQVQGVVGTSTDGDWVYYVALGQVVAGQGTAGQPNLYLWHDDGSADGQTRFVATLVPPVSVSDRRDQSNWLWSSNKTSRVTADGQRLLFQSLAAIPGHDNGGFSQVYLYDAAANSGAGLLDCVSCNPDGDPPLGPSDLGQIAGLSTEDPLQYPRNLAAGGSRIFFNSADALVEEDTNGKLDAYMWEESDLRLLSTGESDDDSRFYDASADGDSAFILTREQLVGWDGDTAADLYVARVGGGFPEPVSPHVDDCPVLSDGCQAPGSSGPMIHVEETDRPRGGNERPAARARLAIANVSAKARRRAAVRGVLAVRIRTSKAGVVRVVGKARLGGRSRKVGAVRKRLGIGVATLRLPLSKGARRRLDTGRVLRLSLTVSQPEARPRSLTVALRKAGR